MKRLTNKKIAKALCTGTFVEMSNEERRIAISNIPTLEEVYVKLAKYEDEEEEKDSADRD